MNQYTLENLDRHLEKVSEFVGPYAAGPVEKPASKEIVMLGFALRATMDVVKELAKQAGEGNSL